MANRYAVAGRTAATAATADNVAAELWNPHGTKSLYVREVWVFATTATTAMNLGIVRSSAKGTSTLTVTPDADNAFDRRAVPPSGCTLELTFSAQPTLATPYLLRAIAPTVIGAGWVWPFPQPIEVVAGTGLCIATPMAVAFPIADATYVWDE